MTTKTDFWQPLDLDRLVAEKGEEARYENLVATSPLTPQDSADLRAVIDADRKAQRERIRA